MVEVRYELLLWQRLVARNVHALRIEPFSRRVICVILLQVVLAGRLGNARR